MNLFFRIVLYIFAAISIWYSLMIWGVHSGSKFFLIWDAFAVLLIVLGLLAKYRIYAKIPKKVSAIILSIMGVGLIIFVFLLVKVLSGYKEQAQENVDYIIVLGAQVRQDGLSNTLNYRMEKALEYLQDNPDTKCVCSGGQGSNEPCSEARAMKEYLVAHGIEAERILTEDKSTNTRENLMFSKVIIEADYYTESNSLFLDNSAIEKSETGEEGTYSIIGAPLKIAIVTSNFHVARAKFLAGKLGYGEIQACPAYSVPFYGPNNVFREMLGLIKDYIC